MINIKNQFSERTKNRTAYFSFYSQLKKDQKSLSPRLLIKTKSTHSNVFTKNNTPLQINYLKNKNSQESFFYSNIKINKYNQRKNIYNEIKRNNFSKKIKTKSELDIFHINHIKEKIFQFQRKQLLSNDNVMPKKNENYFITSLSENQSKRNEKDKLKIPIDLDSIKSNIEIENNNTSLYIKYIKSLNLNNKAQIKNKDNFNSHLKFNNILQNYFSDLSFNDEIESNRESIETLIKRKNAKFRYKIINQVQHEKLLRLVEENETNSFITKKLNSFKNFEKYFYKLNEALRKYLIFLFGKIDHGNKEIKYLWTKKTKLLKEIFELKKKISSVSEKRQLLINMKLLCIMIKCGKKSLKELSYSESKKYGLDKTNNNYSPKIKIKIKNHLMKNIRFKRRRSFAKLEIPEAILTIEQKRRAVTPKHKINYQIIEEGFVRQNVNKKRRTIEFPNNKNRKKRKSLAQVQIFNNTEELMQRFKDIENKLKDSYKQYSKIFSINLKLKEEKKELEDYHEQDINEDYEEKLIKELKKEKLLNKKLCNKRDEIYSELNSKNKTGILSNKLKNIILNFDINIEKFLEVSNIYDAIKNVDRRNINYNGRCFSKEMFILKIIELLLTKLIELKNKCKGNINLKKKYLVLKKDHEKKIAALRVKQKKNEEHLKRMKIVDNIIAKNNKILFLPIKRDDPFQKKIMENNIIKKQKRNVDKSKSVDSNKIYEGFIQYDNI